jgi:hypothetical protein
MTEYEVNIEFSTHPMTFEGEKNMHHGIEDKYEVL